MRHVILATAGHIDHGKTALVQALTGIDTDRLPEEKQRGITIDLGFANLQLGDLSVGVVDVPGHEDFIRNMLAGATGMDVVLMVVAADEGVMPQTREHLAILDLLAVRNGVVAITKCDLVGQEWLDLVTDDVRETLKATTLRDAPILAVSARSGAGLRELRDAITEQALRNEARRADDLFRMPIDRVFTVRGTGTVVTGTVWSGTVQMDESVELLPAGVRTRVRGVQVHGEPVRKASAGERAALALAGLEKQSLARGDVALVSDVWQPVHMLVACTRVISESAWSLVSRQRVRVHAGTAEVLARVMVLDGDRIGPGENGWIQLRLEQPLVARVGDRLVLRSYSPVTTIAGGEVAELSHRKRARLTPADVATFRTILRGPPRDAVLAVLASRAGAGAAEGELPIITPHPPRDVKSALAALERDIVKAGNRIFDLRAADAGLGTLLDVARGLHAAHPLKPVLDRAEVRAGLRALAPELAEYAINRAIEGRHLVASGSAVALRDFRPELTARQAVLKEAVLSTLKEGGIAPPTIGELSRTLGDAREIQQVLRLLEYGGAVRSISPDFYLDAEALAAAQTRTQAELGGLEGLSAAEFRATLPVSRKHLIPLLEYFDRVGITVRNGELRRVIPASRSDLYEGA